AKGCGAKEVARTILDHTSTGVGTVRAVRTTLRAEAVEHRLLPRGAELEHCAAAGTKGTSVRTPGFCGAVQVACGVLDHSCFGTVPVRAVRTTRGAEAVEHRLCPGATLFLRRCHLEHRAPTVSTPGNCGSV